MTYIIIGVLAVVLAVCILIYGRRKDKELLTRLEDMLEKARNGTFDGGRSMRQCCLPLKTPWPGFWKIAV